MDAPYLLDVPILPLPSQEDLHAAMNSCWGAPKKRARDDFEYPVKHSSERMARKRQSPTAAEELTQKKMRNTAHIYAPFTPVECA